MGEAGPSKRGKDSEITRESGRLKEYAETKSPFAT